MCPVDAIGVEGIPVPEWKELVECGNGPLHLSCRRYGTGRWSCLGFLNARDLVALAWPAADREPRDVFVYSSHCRECRPAVAESLAREMAAANRFLARFGCDRVLTGHKPPPPERDIRAMDRRSFFASLLSTGIETARNVMWPEDGAVPLPKAHWRAQLLRGRNPGETAAAQDTFDSLAVASHCIACGLCAKICPVHAITAEEDDASMELWHEPLLCTGCGLCIAHCPVDAVTIVREGQAAKQRLIVQEFPRCNECGALFKPAGQQLTCFDCLLKGRQSIFGP